MNFEFKENRHPRIAVEPHESTKTNFLAALPTFLIDPFKLSQDNSSSVLNPSKHLGVLFSIASVFLEKTN